MASYFLKLPNGRLAVFSTELAKFTFFDMSVAESFEYGAARWGRDTADIMVADALGDVPLDDSETLDGLSRWRFALTTIARNRGISGINEELGKIGIADADIPQSALDAALGALH